jgi:rod shape-determining protein MreC
MFSKTAAAAIILFASCAVALIFLSVPSRIEPVKQPLSGKTLNVTAPPQGAVTGVLGFAASVWEHYFSLVNTSSENEQLRRRLDEASQAHIHYEEAKRENGRLRDLLAFARKTPGRVVTARVVAEDPSHWFSSVILDKGAVDGVRRGNAVVTPLGVAGKITATARNYSQVLLVTDPNSALDARVARTRARGIVEGAVGGGCRFKYVQRKEDVRVGDQILSSGFDRVVPPGVAVGVVVSVQKGGRGMFQEVEIRPHVDFETLEEVLIILDQVDIPPMEEP